MQIAHNNLSTTDNEVYVWRHKQTYIKMYSSQQHLGKDA